MFDAVGNRFGDRGGLELARDAEDRGSGRVGFKAMVEADKSGDSGGVERGEDPKRLGDDSIDDGRDSASFATAAARTSSTVFTQSRR